MRLIDIDDDRNCFCGNDGEYEKWNIDPDVLKDAITIEPGQHWIPVTERLPERNGRYLVTRGLNACGSLWNRIYVVNYSDLMSLKKEKIWWDGNVGKADFAKLDDVIAWQPLPEPYKEKENDR